MDNSNIMILNGKSIGISRICLDQARLLITDKSLKYDLSVIVYYDWRNINDIKVGEKQDIIFNEYILCENDEPALIWPETCIVEKLTENLICFHISFNDLTKETCYMNKRQSFDIKLKSLEVKVTINYKDVVGDSIIYEY